MRSFQLTIAALFLLSVGVTACSSSDPAPQNTIVDVAADAGSFTTLVAALEAVDLDVVLAGDGPFTVFAPTDDAFAQLPDGTLEDLLLPENRDQLVDILTFHVVSGRVQLSDILSATSATTLNGADVPIGLSVEGAAVTSANIEASNGLIHVIDTVLLP